MAAVVTGQLLSVAERLRSTNLAANSAKNPRSTAMAVDLLTNPG